MKSSKEQSFWMGFGLLMLVLLGGSGFFFYQSYNKYENSNSNYDSLKLSLGKLEGYKIYPSEENLKVFKEKLDEFEAEVNKLHDDLGQFQEEELRPIPAQDFGQKLKERVTKFRAYAYENKVALPPDFYMGMDRYADVPPREEATGILTYQLDAIEHLLQITIDNEGDLIFAVDREEAAVEIGEPDPELTERVVKYTVNIAFRTTHDGFQAFLNQVSNDDKFFYDLRVLRIDNLVKEGPSKIRDQQDVYVGPDGKIIDPADMPTNRDELFLQDAEVIMGNEQLKVNAVIDMCRFPKVEEKVDEEENEDNKPKNR